MAKHLQHIFDYDEYRDSSELCGDDKNVLDKARMITKNAYAPYSKFFVGAAALLDNGEIITATNQENASYPVGLCAERVLLSAISAVHANKKIISIAISYSAKGGDDVPISPCGICRQTLLEYEQRNKQPIKIILSGQTGKVFVINKASLLLPFGFTNEDLHGE